jgi:hypothetical protein
VLALAFTIVPGVARAAPDTAAGTGGHKLTLRLATGVAYLHESWSPNDGNPGSVQHGWAPVLEVAVGRVLSPRLIVGGVWQIASVFSLTESFAGTDYHFQQVAKLSNLVGAYAEDPRLPHLPIRVGIAVGAVASSFLDTAQAATETTWALAVSPYVGYDHQLSKRWAVGAIARVNVYRSLFSDTPSSATTTGLLPSLLAAFTFR